MSSGDAARNEILRELSRLRRSATPAAEIDRSWFRALEESEQFRHFLRHMKVLLGELDEEGRFVYVSDSIAHISGYRPDELIGTIAHEQVHPDDIAVLAEMQRTASGSGNAGGKPATYRVRTKRGGWAWIETPFVQRFLAEDGTIHGVTFSRDVTELKRAEERLRESEERYRVVVESSPDTVFESDPDGQISFLSGGSEGTVGYTEEELARIPPFSLVHPDDVDALRAAFDRALERLEPCVLEAYRVRHKDGSWRWLRSTGIGYKRANAELRFLNLTRDITEEIEEERRRRQFEARREQAQRLESLGVMAGGIAHDFNNLLTPILGEASLALADLPRGSPLRLRLERIRRAARRAADLTNQMLAYAGADEVERESIDLSQLMHEVPQLLESMVSEKTSILYELEGALPAVLGNVTQLSQVAMNLVSNAAEAVGDAGGRIVIRTGMLELDARSTYTFPDELVEAGSYVFLEVEDSGSGMDEETRARIFDPFFTTKFTGRGLGLAAVLGVIQAHRGALELETELGQGTRFRVLLPAMDPAVVAGAELAAPEQRASSDARILVIDDDPAVVEVVKETLRRAGLESLTAADGPDGVAAFERHADEVDLVILDRAMPGMSGREVLSSIRAIRAGARVLMMSGYSESHAASRFADEQLAGFLQKPFLPETLLEKVRQLL